MGVLLWALATVWPSVWLPSYGTADPAAGDPAAAKAGIYAGLAALFTAIGACWLLALSWSPLTPDRRRRVLWGVPLAATLSVWGGFALEAAGLAPWWAGQALGSGILALGTGGSPLATRTATLHALAFAVLGLAFGGPSGPVAAWLAGGWIFAVLAAGARTRPLLAVRALGTGLAAAAVQGGAFYVAAHGRWRDAWEALLEPQAGGWPLAGAAVAMWGLAGLALAPLGRVLETGYGLTTRMRLLSLLGDQNPLIKRLVAEAPGTYHHSVLVGTLAEAGAVAAGGDGLLARAGGFYHDIGKLTKPAYFTENEAGASRHDHISPYLSALVLVGHVKDGEELAWMDGLPPAVAHIVASHHGTAKMAYFLHRARQELGPGESLEESAFAYPGPLPGTPEAAAVMLADALEATARSQGGASPGRMRSLVRDNFDRRLREGQLAASGLDLTRVDRMEEAMYRVLLGMYHHRVKYPGQKGTA